MGSRVEILHAAPEIGIAFRGVKVLRRVSLNFSEVFIAEDIQQRWLAYKLSSLLSEIRMPMDDLSMSCGNYVRIFSGMLQPECAL